MASFFYIVVKSDSWTSPSCLTLSLAKHCHPSPIKIYTLLCLSVLKSAREIFMHLNFHKQFLFCLSTIVIGCDWCTRPRFMFSLLSQMVPLPVTRGRIQHTDPGHPHPAITGWSWPWLLTWGGGGGNQGVEDHHGPAQTRHSRHFCWDSLHFNKPYDNNKSCKNTKSLKNDSVFPFYLYKRLFPTAWGWFVVKFWSKDLSIFYKEILQ